MIKITDLQQALDILNSGTIDEYLSINLNYKELGEQNLIALAKALESGNYSCKSLVAIWLYKTAINSNGAITLARALKSGKCPVNLKLYLSSNKIGDAGLIALADALQSGRCPADLDINLSNNDIANAGAIALSKALKSGKCPVNLNLDLSCNKIGVAGAIALADALQSGMCPAGLSIDLTGNNFGDAGAYAFQLALESGMCPADLEIKFNNDSKYIIEALKSGKCPQGLKITINSIDDFNSIINLLPTGKCPNKLSIDFVYNFDFNDLHFVDIINALKSGSCPESLKIKTPFKYFIHKKTLDALLLAINTGNLPLGLKLGFEINDELMKEKHTLKELFKHGHISMLHFLSYYSPNGVWKNLISYSSLAFYRGIDRALNGDIKEQLKYAKCFEDGVDSIFKYDNRPNIMGENDGALYKNINKALYLYKAIIQNSKCTPAYQEAALDGLFRIAKHYEGNILYSRNMTKAVELYNFAALLGHQNSVAAINRLSSKGIKVQRTPAVVTDEEAVKNHVGFMERNTAVATELVYIADAVTEHEKKFAHKLHVA